jgi:uncharacterized membrane protein (DUF2068 family)
MVLQLSKMFKLNREQPKHSGLIIIYELFTGALELVLGISIIIFGSKLFSVYQKLIFSNFLVFSHQSLADLIQSLVPLLFDHIHFISFFLICLGTLKIICGGGMYLRQWWASYLLVLAIGFLLPFDLVSLFQKLEIYKLILLGVNSAIIYYLVK